MKRPSVLAENIAQKIRDAFQEMGIQCSLFAGDFRTADGFWRKVDVYRWQIHVQLYVNEMWIQAEVSSWASMSMCRRGKLVIERDGYLWDFEAHPVKRRTK